VPDRLELGSVGSKENDARKYWAADAQLKILGRPSIEVYVRIAGLAYIKQRIQHQLHTRIYHRHNLSADEGKFESALIDIL
jgi:hypothetical protein